jgi:hypothetical protein
VSHCTRAWSPLQTRDLCLANAAICNHRDRAYQHIRPPQHCIQQDVACGTPEWDPAVPHREALRKQLRGHLSADLPNYSFGRLFFKKVSALWSRCDLLPAEVKLSQHYGMRYAGVWESGVTAPRILILGARRCCLYRVRAVSVSILLYHRSIPAEVHLGGVQK